MRIFLRGLEEPVYREALAQGMLAPGTAVTPGNGGVFAQAASASGRVMLLDRRDWGPQGDPFANAALDDQRYYASGDTARALALTPGHCVNWRFGAGAYTYGQELTIGAGGRLVAAVAGQTVVAHAAFAATLAAGTLAEAEICAFHKR